MVTPEQVDSRAADLPEAHPGESYGRPTWNVAGKSFAWLRPFSKADVRRFGDAPVPSGPILAIRLADLGEKEAVLAEGRPGVFTIAHFDGYAAVLIQLDTADGPDVRELLLDAWAAFAPPELVERHRPR